MWISFYNKEGVGDVLLLSNGQVNRYEVISETKGYVTQIKDKHEQVIGYNIQEISKWFRPTTQGHIVLTDEQQEQVKQIIDQAGFAVSSMDLSTHPTLVVGYVESCIPHEDSDHLHVTQTRVSEDKVLQIVCGASNVKAGQKVVVATPGTVMPNGSVIWAGELRGVESFGMLCSARELGLTSDQQKKGILVLEDDAQVGSPFAI